MVGDLEMYSQIEVQNFRGFDDLVLSNLKRINLIAGKNNSGKTALLEAIFIHSGWYNPELALRAQVFRGIRNITISSSAAGVIQAIFRNLDVDKSVEIRSKDNKGRSRYSTIFFVNSSNELEGLDLTTSFSDEPETRPSFSSSNLIKGLGLRFTNPDGEETTRYLLISPRGVHQQVSPPPESQSVFIPAIYRENSPEIQRKFSEQVRAGRKDMLVNSLRILEPRLQSVELLDFSGEVVPYGDVGAKQLIPFPLMGEGLNRLLNLLLSVSDAPGGTVLFDEVENGLHYSVLPEVWRAIGQAARDFDVQVFATTHSYECIRAAHEAFRSGPDYDFRYHRLDRGQSGGIEAITYSEEEMEAALDINYEVRG
jgi:hypothetical protein